MGVDIAFWVFAAAAVWFGWRVFRTDSMVRASFALLASLLNAGAIMVLLAGEYLGMAVWFMMAVEMTVMAIFMVAFMMNPAGLNPMQMVHQHRTAIAAGVSVFAALVVAVLSADLPDRPLRDAAGAIRALGHEVMGSSMLVMQSVAVTLLATMVGATVLTSRRGRYGPSDEGSLPPSLDPDAPPDAPVLPTGHAPGSVAGGGHGGHGGDGGGGGHGGHG
ncbi:MAG: NADH-quinone oxidoreductase subunit J [Actinomycetota bacterium]|nr:NADH-quinone oxidoreductase subunit J [Actinomycetota bacterium]